MAWVKVKSDMAPFWDFRTTKEITGVLTDIKTDVGPHKSKLYTLEDAKGKQTAVWGTTILDGLMSKVIAGQELKIIYLGEKKNPKGGNDLHNFELEVNDGK